VSFTLMFASWPPFRISSSTSTYESTIASASAGLRISSPRTSIVAVFPDAFSPPTTRIASPTVSPAMYRSDSRFTTVRGTAGSMRTIALS
jgi:hypothetical protein